MNLSGYIEKGELKVYQRGNIDKFIRRYEGKSVRIKFTVSNEIRSIPQNAYYWGVVVKMITDEFRRLGHPLNETDTHEFLKGKFNTIAICNREGETIEVPQSTADLHFHDFWDYTDRIKNWANDFLNIYIPEPTTSNF